MKTVNFLTRSILLIDDRLIYIGYPASDVLVQSGTLENLNCKSDNFIIKLSS